MSWKSSQQNRELGQCLAVLRQPGWKVLFSKELKEARIQALAQIAAEGNASYIGSLTGYLSSGNKQLREEACRAIIHLFHKIKIGRGAYQTLKYCKITKAQIAHYKIAFPTDAYVELLAISTFNSNGYVREYAVKKLAEVKRPGAIPFLIYRLSDWVLPVRERALESLRTYMTVDYIDEIIKNLSLFEMLQKVERVNLGEVYQQLVEFIVKHNREYALANFEKYPDQLRRLLARHLSLSMADGSREIELFMADPHFVIRNLANTHFNKLNDEQIQRLLGDKSPMVRFQTLYNLKTSKNFKALIRNYLADKSGAIRNLARYSLRDAKVDFAGIYSENLKERRHIIGSLAGMAELDAKQHDETVKLFVVAPEIKTRRAAFLALTKLDAHSAYLFAMENLDNAHGGIRNSVIDFLAAHRGNEVLEKARSIYMAGNEDLKVSMLQLLKRIGGWAVIPDLMLGTIDASKTIREVSLLCLRMWKSHAGELYIRPDQQEKERALETFTFVSNTHNEKRYFASNPLEGLDFYLN